MNPQPRGIVPPEHVETIQMAIAQVGAAYAARDAAITAALLAGGSVREVATLTGMSPTTIQKIGHAGGWPSKTQKAARAKLRQENAEFADMMSAAEIMAKLLEQSEPGEQPN